jgi:hypothetical protein
MAEIPGARTLLLLRDPKIDRIVYDGRDMTIIAVASEATVESTVARLSPFFQHLVVRSRDQLTGEVV